MDRHFRLVTTITLIVILLSLVLIWIFAGASRLSAEGADTTAASATGGDTVLSMSIKQLTQDPKTLEIPLALSVYSTKNSDRVQITWDIPRGLQIIGENTFSIAVNTENPTVIETRFKPVQAGRYDIRVKAEMFSAEVNYVSSASYTVAVGNNLETLPVTEEYKKAKMEYQTKEILKYTGISLGVLGVIVVAVVAFRKWLNAED